MISKNRQRKCDKGLHEYTEKIFPEDEVFFISKWFCMHCDKQLIRRNYEKN